MDDGTTLLGTTPHEIALLRGGPRAAVTVAVIALHPRGAVGPGPPVTVRAVRGPRAGGLTALPSAGAPLDPADGRPGTVTRAERARCLESAVYRRL